MTQRCLPRAVTSSGSSPSAGAAPSLSIKAAACGADGLIIEVHNDPVHALCDGAQSLKPEEYDRLAKKVRAVREVLA